MYGYEYKKVPIEELVGKTIKEVEGLEKYSEQVVIKTQCGKEYRFCHFQDCCESVQIEDFETESDDYSGALITSSECVTNRDDESKPNEYAESWTWTFYKIETNKGGIYMRWLGESNGWYGEEVDFVLVVINDKQSSENRV